MDSDRPISKWLLKHTMKSDTKQLTTQKTITPKKEDEILTADEVGLMLKKSEAAVWRMAQREQLPHFRMGRNIRFWKSSILEYLENLEGVSTEEALNEMKRKR